MPLLGLFIVSLLAFYGMASADSTIKGLSDKRLPITLLIGDARIHTNAIMRFVWQDISARSESERAQVKEEMQKRFLEMEKCLTELDAIGLVPENKKNLQEFLKIWTPLRDKYQKIVSQVGVVSQEESVAQMSQTAAESSQLTEILLRMGKVLIEANKTAKAEAQALSDELRLTITMVGSVLLLLSLVLVVYTSYVLKKSFTDISGNLALAGRSVASASQEMSKSSFALSSSSMEGAASLEETVASLEEINSQVSLNSARAIEAQGLSTTVINSSKAWAHSLSELQGSIHEIEKSSKHIQEIIGIIDDIAFQTNLLALNASVEAARAGEQGRGFAVVADAVRGLSQRSANSAREISQLINESAEKTAVGVRLVGASQDTMKEVFQVIEKLATLNSEIAQASSEQAQGLKQISTATNQIDAATQSNAAAAEEASATAEQLRHQSGELYGLVNELMLVVHGKSQLLSEVSQ